MDKKLAILGGEPVVKTKGFGFPLVAPKAKELINGMLDRGEISTSPIVTEFETKFAEYIGRKYSLCECNGTTSIQAGLFAVGVGAGDEVICPSFTFWASVGPIVCNGAIPVFVDVDADTHCISAKAIEKAITPKTKAVLIVHVWGNPCDMDAIVKICKKHNLKLVEDCSHAHGATYKGKKVGTFGDVGCFSLQASKVLPSGEGGILLMDKFEYYERAIALGHYNLCPKLGDDSPYRQYALTSFGFKHRINPLAAPIALANLELLDERNKIRNDKARYFESLLADLPFIVFQKEYEGAEKVFAYHYAQYLPEKFGNVSLATFLNALAKEGVVCGWCGYGKLHESLLFTKKGPFKDVFPFTIDSFMDECHAQGELENTKVLADTVFMAAPRFDNATEKDIKSYSDAYHKIADNMKELIELEKREHIVRAENEGRSINYVKV